MPKMMVAITRPNLPRMSNSGGEVGFGRARQKRFKPHFWQAQGRPSIRPDLVASTWGRWLKLSIKAPKTFDFADRPPLKRHLADDVRDGIAALSRHQIAALQSLDHTGIDQEAVEALGLRAVAAGIEHALASQHDLLLLREGGIERNAGSLLDHQRQIGAIDRVHHRRTLHRFEIDRVDRIIGRVIAWIVAVELASDADFIQLG